MAPEAVGSPSSSGRVPVPSGSRPSEGRVERSRASTLARVERGAGAGHGRQLGLKEHEEQGGGHEGRDQLGQAARTAGRRRLTPTSLLDVRGTLPRSRALILRWRGAHGPIAS